MQDVISFSFSKVKIIVGFVVLTFFVLVFLVLLASSLFYGIPLGTISSIFFFSVCFLGWLDRYKVLRKYLQGLPALQLTPHSLIDNTNNISFAWKDVLDFKDVSVNTGKGGKSHSIAISLNNEAEYLSLVQGWRTRLMAQLNRLVVGSPFSIETNTIKESRSTVLQSLNDFKNKYSHSR